MNTRKKGVLLIGGEMPPISMIRQVIQGASLVVAADSGFDVIVDHDLPFDYVVGDMDSTHYLEKIRRIPQEKVIWAHREKDETDTEMGLELLREKGMNYTVILGGGGGRLDHLLGIVSLFDRENYPNEWYTTNEMVFSIDGPSEFQGWKGDTVSFFPTGGDTCRMRSAGLKWPLDDLVWERGDNGISNVVVEEVMKVEALKGRLICIRTVAKI